MTDEETRQKATVQDDVRERQIALHCGLTRTGKRAGADALDENGNPYELKSATKTGISTGRDIGIHTIAVYRKEYWVIAEGTNYEEPPELKKFVIRALYIAHPRDLESWFVKIESRIKNELEICETVLAAAQASGVDVGKIAFCRTKLLRGVTLNNPKIPMQLVRQNATLLDPSNGQAATEQIRQFVRNNPLPEAQTGKPSAPAGSSGNVSSFE